MLCQSCKQRPATVHFKQTINKNQYEGYLCEQCYAKQNFMPKVNSFFNFNDFFAPIAYTIPQQQLSCEKCGMTITEFSESGKLGCQQCYSVFRNSLDPIIRQVHGQFTHIGKFPPNVSQTMKIKKSIDNLKIELKKSVEEERYEDAAKIRDEIKILNEQIGEVQ